MNVLPTLVLRLRAFADEPEWDELADEPEWDEPAALSPKTAEGIIADKFLQAHVNMQAELSRSQALAGKTHVDKPRLANESDAMFRNFGNCVLKTDL